MQQDNFEKGKLNEVCILWMTLGHVYCNQRYCTLYQCALLKYAQIDQLMMDLGLVMIRGIYIYVLGVLGSQG